MNLTDLAVSGPLLLAALLAIAAGAVSFASPCCLPLVPGYLAYLAGLVGADPPPVTGEAAARPISGRWRVAGAALLFVLGFTVVFTAATMAVLGLSDALLANEELLQRIGGVVTIAMGLVFLGMVPMLQRGVKLRHKPRDGLWGAPVLGAVYGLGWTPCLGPTLAGVIALASGTQVGPTTGRGLLLITAYCLGLGLPFILLALGARWAVNATSWVRRHIRRVQQVGGVLLIVIGVALVTGLWGEVIAWLRGPIASFTIPI
ncbi:cytochrome c biogenesis CcdA family protein [Amycolatopsis sp. H20-H5]|uniref:cytochrome c biogenesis CcdA family protein n=1 Tax=Amycolatopsis sp. H20-H5 TaxID=3046309 RepID=UPI002DBE3206|nr:cytochrome c biogenesis CcdA family protein [Amycolatopsis sp. H20-H5]MEC3974434.1 cytochrome c biogenesis CcdA family protein [Amycolatopsis sp. H20-H5]